jgi:tRNA pseudouridine55 synthase
MTPKEAYTEGQVLLIDKPLGWTSFQVVNKIKYTLIHALGLPKRFKIGHAGTLDPLASGLLILCTGKWTKKIDLFQAEQKEYTGTITLGATTPSYDLETTPENHQDLDLISPELLQKTTESFVGTIQQTPPLHSAVKNNGERAYEAARRGETVELKSRNITIFAFELTRIDLPQVDFRIACSKGTYIRSLAHDFGQKLGCGAYLSALRRTKSGSFSVDDAWQVEDLVTHIRHEAEKEF